VADAQLSHGRASPWVHNGSRGVRSVTWAKSNMFYHNITYYGTSVHVGGVTYSCHLTPRLSNRVISGYIVSLCPMLPDCLIGYIGPTSGKWVGVSGCVS